MPKRIENYYVSYYKVDNEAMPKNWYSNNVFLYRYHNSLQTEKFSQNTYGEVWNWI